MEPYDPSEISPIVYRSSYETANGVCTTTARTADGRIFTWHFFHDALGREWRVEHIPVKFVGEN